MDLTEENLKDIVDQVKKSTGLTQAQIAEQLGYSRAYLSDAITSGGSSKLIAAIKREFSLESAAPAPGHEAYHAHRFKLKMGKQQPIPVYGGNTRAGQVEVYSDDPAMQTPVATLPATLFPSCNHAEKVTGNSMYPRIINQGYVVGKVIDKGGPITPGEIYGIHYNGQAVVKYLHHRADGLLLLKSDNKEVPDFEVKLEDVTFLFRVYYILNPA